MEGKRMTSAKTSHTLNLPYRRLTAGPGLPASILSNGVSGADWAGKRPAAPPPSAQAARNPLRMGVIVRVFISMVVYAVYLRSQLITRRRATMDEIGRSH